MGAADVVAQSAGRYVDWGVIQISVTNLIIVAVMIVLFLLALFLPFPGPRDDSSADRS